jgi:RNA polymerase sigma-70 factor (ECF subfamily)
MAPDNDPAEIFEAYRPLLFGIAYRMLGSGADAEDIVQEAYLRYRQAGRPVAEPRAFLCTVVTRLCLNQLAAARSRRELYFGPWLPEPLLTEQGAEQSPVERAELYDSLSLAFLVLLEQLTPAERAAFLLREVFDYSYGEIGAILGKEPAACRQLCSRAKRRIAAGRPRFTAPAGAHRELLDAFLQASNDGDLDGLLRLLADDVVLWADSGGKVRGALPAPLRGGAKVARFLLAARGFATEPLSAKVRELNGEAALLLLAGGEARFVFFVSAEGGRITAVRVIGNPAKLASLNRQLRELEASES